MCVGLTLRKQQHQIHYWNHVPYTCETNKKVNATTDPAALWLHSLLRPTWFPFRSNSSSSDRLGGHACLSPAWRERPRVSLHTETRNKTLAYRIAAAAHREKHDAHESSPRHTHTHRPIQMAVKPVPLSEPPTCSFNVQPSNHAGVMELKWR